MAVNETLGIKVVFGGAIGGSFASAFSKASGDVGKLSKEIDALTNARGARRDNEALIDAARAAKEQAEAARQTARDELVAARERQKAADRAADTAARIAKRKKSTNAEKAEAIALRDTASKLADETERAAKAESRAKEHAQARAKAYDKITRDQDRQNKRLGFADDASVLKKIGILNAQKNYAEARQNLTKAKDDFVSLWRSTAVWVTAISGALSAGTFKIARSVSEVADNTGGLADRLGMTTRALQEMQYAGLQNNLAIEDTNNLLEKLQIRLHDAYTKGGEAADALRLLRLDAASLAYMSPDEAVMEISRALQSVPSASDRAALAVKILGKEGAKMANLLAAGPEELEKLREEARKTGFVLGDEAVKNGRAFDAMLKRLGATFDGVRNVIGSGMLPALTDLMGALSGVLLDNMDFFRDTAKLLGDVIRASAPTIVFFSKSLVGLGKAFVAIFEPIFRVIDGLGLWPVVFGFIIGGGGIMIVSRLWGISRAIWEVVTANRALAATSGASGLLSLLGIGGEAAGAAAGTVVIARNLSLGTRIWVGLLSGVGALLRWGGAFLGVLAGAVRWLAIIRVFLIGLGSSLWGSIGSFFAGLGPWLMGALVAAGKGILAFFGTLAGTIVAVIGTAVASFFAGKWLSSWLMGFKWWRGIWEGIGVAIAWVSDKFATLTGNIGRFWDELKHGNFKEAFKRVFESKEDRIKRGVEEVKKEEASRGVSSEGGGSMFSQPTTHVPASASQVAARSAAVTQAGSPVAITVNAAPGQSPEAIARMTLNLLEQRNRRTQSGSFAAA